MAVLKLLLFFCLSLADSDFSPLLNPSNHPFVCTAYACIAFDGVN